MKKHLILVFGAFLLIPSFELLPESTRPDSTGMSRPEPSDDEDFDPDIPRLLRGKIDKAEFHRMRAEYVSRMRGMPHDLPYDPRLKAIAEMKRAEARILRRQGDPEWKQIGPAPIPNGFVPGGLETPVSGRVNAVAVHPTNPDIVYIGTGAGGLYRSLDGGKKWTPLLEDAQSLSIGALALAPSQPSTLYVGTGEPFPPGFLGVGVYRIDAADTANPRVSGPFNRNEFGNDAMTRSSISRILVHPTNPNHILVGTVWASGGFGRIVFILPNALGLYRSTNAGSASPTFTRLNVPDNGPSRAVTDMIYEPGNPDNLLCAVQSFNFVPDGPGVGGIWRSTNAQADNPTFRQVNPLNSINIYADFAACKVGDQVTILAATSEIDTANGCGSTRGGLLRRSTDGGQTWSAPISGISGYCGGQCFYNIAVAMSPVDPNAVYVGGQGRAGTIGACGSVTFGKSTDGVNFVRSERGLYVDTHAIEVAPSNPSVVYTGNDAGIFKSTDAGTTWTSLNNSDLATVMFHGVGLHPTDRNFCIGGTQDIGTELRRADGTWTQADISDGGPALIDSNVRDTSNVLMYHTYFNARNVMIGFLRARTTACAEIGNWDWRGCGIVQPNKGCVGEAIAANNGINCGDNPFFYAPLALGPGTPNTVYFGTDKLYRSADAGDTMTPVGGPFAQVPGSTLGVPVTAIGISPRDDAFRVVGLNNGKVFRATSGSTVFDDISGSIPAGFFITQTVIDPTDDTVAYVTLNGFGLGLGQHIWKTTNLKASRPTWRASSNGIPDAPVNDLAIDPKKPNELYAATDIGVFRSLDGGGNWEPFNQGLPRVPVFGIELHPSHRFLRIATHGRGMWDLQLPRDPDTTPPVVALAAPRGGETLAPASSFEIRWTASDDVAVTRQDIGFSSDGGASFPTVVATGLSGAATSFAWSVPSMETKRGRIRVTALDEAENRGSAESAADFSITGTADFTLASDRATETVTAGDSTRFTITIQGVNGFAGPVSLAAAVDPSVAGVSARVSAASVETGGAATVTVETTSATPAGTFTVTVTGTGGQPARTKTTLLSVTVQSSDFALGFAAPSVTIQKGAKTKLTVNVVRGGGFAGAVTVTPPDGKALKLKITPATQTATGASVEFTIKAKSSATAGTYPLTFTGKDAGGRTRTATVNLVVQ